VKTATYTNDKIPNLSSVLNQTQQDLAATRKELAGRETLLTATADDYAEWEQRLVEVAALISAIQTEINTLNTELLATETLTAENRNTMDPTPCDRVDPRHANHLRADECLSPRPIECDTRRSHETRLTTRSVAQSPPAQDPTVHPQRCRLDSHR
jgi:hypothetical protein